jgi:hypothetical protein
MSNFILAGSCADRTQSVDHAAFCGAPAFHRASAHRPETSLGTLLSSRCAFSRSHHNRLLSFRDSAAETHPARRRRLRSFHGVGRLALCRRRRDSPTDSREGHSSIDIIFAARQRLFVKRKPGRTRSVSMGCETFSFSRSFSARFSSRARHFYAKRLCSRPPLDRISRHREMCMRPMNFRLHRRRRSAGSFSEFF